MLKKISATINIFFALDLFLILSFSPIPFISIENLTYHKVYQILKQIYMWEKNYFFLSLYIILTIYGWCVALRNHCITNRTSNSNEKGCILLIPLVFSLSKFCISGREWILFWYLYGIWKFIFYLKDMYYKPWAKVFSSSSTHLHSSVMRFIFLLLIDVSEYNIFSHFFMDFAFTFVFIL